RSGRVDAHVRDRLLVDRILVTLRGEAAGDLDPVVGLEPARDGTGEPDLDRLGVGGAAGDDHAGQVPRAAVAGQYEAGQRDVPASQRPAVVVRGAGGVVEQRQ